MADSTHYDVHCVVLIGILLLGGCTGSPGGVQSPAEQSHPLSGQVYDARTHDGLSGVRIEISNQSTVTGDDGRFSFEALPPGQYTLRATKDGYRQRELAVRLRSNRTISFDMRGESFYEPGQSSLADTHWTANVSCVDCHDDTAGEITSVPPDSVCTDCHPTVTIENATGSMEPNPHDDPHRISRDCGSCHRVHDESMLKCTECHSDMIVEAVP